MGDWSKDYGGFSKPMACLSINGEDIDIYGGKKGMKVVQINVEKTVGCEASTCVVKIKAERTGDESFTPKFFKKLKPGALVEIDLGYEKKMERVFSGYIFSVELDVDASYGTVVVVKGMDGKIWMMSNCKYELKKDVNTYSGAAGKVLNEYASKFEGSPTVKVSHEPKLKVPIYQRNESDYAFLCRMASLTGAWFYVDNGEVKFVGMYSGKKAKNPIEGDIISKLRLSFDLWGIPKEIETVFRDKKKYMEKITGKSKKSDDIGKGKSASNLAKNITSTVTLIDNTISAKDEADFISQAEMNRVSSNFVNVRVDLKNGIPDLKLGSTYEIKDMGDSIDNSYMLCGVEHEFSVFGYTSSILLRSSIFDASGSGLF